MPVITNLYNDILTGARNTGGTWLKVTGPGPAAPGTYNGDIDFDGTTEGRTIYSYTVVSGACSDISYATVDYYIKKVRSNNECAGAINVLGFGGPGLSAGIRAETLADECPGPMVPTAGLDPIPVAWGAGSFSGDVWYRVNAPSSLTPYGVYITADGNDYPDGVITPVIAAYTGTCASLVLENAERSLNNGQASVFVSVPASTVLTIYVRVACVQGTEGKFSLVVQGI